MSEEKAERRQKLEDGKECQTLSSRHGMSTVVMNSEQQWLSSHDLHKTLLMLVHPHSIVDWGRVSKLPSFPEELQKLTWSLEEEVKCE